MRFKERVYTFLESAGGGGMREEVLRQVAELLAGELDGASDDLDSLEGQVLQVMRRVGRATLQRKLEGKKRATRAAGSPADAAAKRGS